MLMESAEVADAPRYAQIDALPVPEHIDDLLQRLAQARSPVAILGGTRWSADAVAQFTQIAERLNLPVAVSFRRQMLFPADHPCFIGDVGLGSNPEMMQYIKDSDLVLLLGGRLSEIPSQAYTLLDIPLPRQTLVHVHPDPSELNRVYRADVAINSSPVRFVEALNTATYIDDVRRSGTAKISDPAKADATAARAALIERLHASYLAWTTPDDIRTPGALQMGQVMAYLERALPADAIMTNGAGNYATWLHRFHRFTRYGTQLAPTSGSMGYGLPAAVGAKRIAPEKTVVCFAGDGCFLMHGQEFATAVQYELPIIVVLIDNGMYGTIRMHQERTFPARISATELKNPDFAEYARAFGGHGETVQTHEEFGPAFERARASGRPAIVHCFIDPDTISPTTTLSKIRAGAQSSKAS